MKSTLIRAFFPYSHGTWFIITTQRTYERSLHHYLREYVLKDSVRGILQDNVTSQNDDSLPRGIKCTVRTGDHDCRITGTLFYWEVCELPPNSSFGSHCVPFGRGYQAVCQCAPVKWLILASQRVNQLGSQLAPIWCFPHLVAHVQHLRGVAGWAAHVLLSNN